MGGLCNQNYVIKLGRLIPSCYSFSELFYLFNAHIKFKSTILLVSSYLFYLFCLGFANLLLSFLLFGLFSITLPPTPHSLEVICFLTHFFRASLETYKKIKLVCYPLPRQCKNF